MASELNSIVRNSLKEKLAAGRVVSSMTVRLVPNIEIVRLIKTAGFDSFYIDLEHSSLSFETTSQLAVMALAAEIPCFVRIPENRGEYIQWVLDGGASGIIAPGIRSADEARAVVAAAKYPPLGTRGASGGLPHLQFRSFPTADAWRVSNEATMVIVMFESGEALERADEIAAVDGVDMVMIGTNDLMGDLGIAGQFDHPKVKAAYARTIEACRKYGKHVGVGGLASRDDLVAEFVRMGARYVSTGTDLGFLLGAATARAKFVAGIVG